MSSVSDISSPLSGRSAIAPVAQQLADVVLDRVLGELAAAGYARKEGTRGAISTGGPQPGPPADAAMALGITDPSRQVIVRRRLAAAPDDTPVQFRVSYIPAELAEGTPIAQSTAITDAWPAALTTYLGKQVRLASSQVTARHPNHEEAAALALPSDAAVLVREDIYKDRRGSRSTSPEQSGPADLNLPGCPIWTPFTGQAIAGPYRQVLGEGCVYPAAVPTLGNQLSAAGRSWAAYLQDMGNDPARDHTVATAGGGLRPPRHLGHRPHPEGGKGRPVRRPPRRVHVLPLGHREQGLLRGAHRVVPAAAG